MNKEEIKAFERFLRETLEDGSSVHELRLSEDERRCLADKYPRISLELITYDCIPDGYRALTVIASK